jgi:hypothetical protein
MPDEALKPRSKATAPTFPITCSFFPAIIAMLQDLHPLFVQHTARVHPRKIQ